MFKYLLVPLLLASQILLAQSNTREVAHQKLAWFRYYNKINIGSWSLHTEIEDRRFAFPDRQHQWILPRVHIHRKLNQGFEAAVGVSYFLQSTPNDAESTITLVVPEFRPHQEISFKSKHSKLEISHRYRIEERFFRKTMNDELASGYRFNFRTRYQFQLSYPVIETQKKQGSLDVKLYDEIMLNFGKEIVFNTFDQNRIGIALQYAILQSVNIQVDMLNWFQQRSSGQAYYNRWISRFTLTHTIN